MAWIQKYLPGMALCLSIAIIAWFLGNLAPVVGGPVFSILLGMAITPFLRERAPLTAGINFTSKKILQYAVILLGFGLNLSVIAQTGLQSLPIIASTIATSLLLSYLLFRLLRLPSNLAVLVGVGSSICGGSAIAATAPVIGADDEEVAQSISVIFLFNVIAALIFPTLGGLVTAAAASWDAIHGSNTLETATIVKLTRTLAIIPITLVLALFRTRQASQTGGRVRLRKIFPWFILFFILASVVTTVCTALGAPASVFSPLKDLSKFFIIWAMAAIGLNTNLVKLVKTGGKPILLGFCCWVGIACVSLLMQHLLQIW